MTKETRSLSIDGDIIDLNQWTITTDSSGERLDGFFEYRGTGEKWKNAMCASDSLLVWGFGRAWVELDLRPEYNHVRLIRVAR